MSRSQAEFKLQCVVVDYLTTCAPTLVWTAFPAGENRDARTGARLKRMGLKPGWPDILAIGPEGRLIGLELKADAGRQSPLQKAMQALLEAAGARYAVIRSLDDLKAVLGDLGVSTRERAA